MIFFKDNLLSEVYCFYKMLDYESMFVKGICGVGHQSSDCQCKYAILHYCKISLS